MGRVIPMSISFSYPPYPMSIKKWALSGMFAASTLATFPIGSVAAHSYGNDWDRDWNKWDHKWDKDWDRCNRNDWGHKWSKWDNDWDRDWGKWDKNRDWHD